MKSSLSVAFFLCFLMCTVMRNDVKRRTGTKSRDKKKKILKVGASKFFGGKEREDFVSLYKS